MFSSLRVEQLEQQYDLCSLVQAHSLRLEEVDTLIPVTKVVAQIAVARETCVKLCPEAERELFIDWLDHGLSYE